MRVFIEGKMNPPWDKYLVMYSDKVIIQNMGALNEMNLFEVSANY